MSLHTIYEHPECYQTAGMWKHQLDSLNGIMSIFPGVDWDTKYRYKNPINHKNYSSSVRERNIEKGNATREIMVEALDGCELTMSEWAERANLPYTTIHNQIKTMKERGMINKIKAPKRVTKWSLVKCAANAELRGRTLADGPA